MSVSESGAKTPPSRAGVSVSVSSTGPAGDVMLLGSSSEALLDGRAASEAPKGMSGVPEQDEE